MAFTSKQIEWFKNNGFSTEGDTYAVWGMDTYSIKDTLKELGCKYLPTLGWHCSQSITLPSDEYKLVLFHFDDIMIWLERDERAYFTPQTKEFIEKTFTNIAGPSSSEYMGQIGERLRHLPATVKSCKRYEGMYGLTRIITFQVGENELVWITNSSPLVSEGETVDLTGTVKAHKDFKGIKQTQLSRCIIQ